METIQQQHFQATRAVTSPASIHLRRVAVECRCPQTGCAWHETHLHFAGGPGSGHSLHGLQQLHSSPPAACQYPLGASLAVVAAWSPPYSATPARLLRSRVVHPASAGTPLALAAALTARHPHPRLHRHQMLRLRCRHWSGAGGTDCQTGGAAGRFHRRWEGYHSPCGRCQHTPQPLSCPPHRPCQWCRPDVRCYVTQDCWLGQRPSSDETKTWRCLRAPSRW